MARSVILKENAGKSNIRARGGGGGVVRAACAGVFSAILLSVGVVGGGGEFGNFSFIHFICS